MNFKILAALWVLSALVGCSPDQPEEPSKAIEEGDTTCFVVVNGTPIVAEQVKTAVLIESRMRELAGSAVKTNEFAKWANGRAMRLVGALINNELIRSRIREESIKPTAADVATALTNYNRQVHGKFKTVEELADAFGDLKEDFRRQFDQSVELAAFDRLYWTDSVTDDDVRQYYAIRTNELRRAERINAEAFKHGKEAYARLKAGEQWDEVAKMSEDALLDPKMAKYAQHWMRLDREALGIPELKLALKTMKPGDFTEPLDTRFGLIIVRLNEVDHALFGVSRILFRMAKDVHIEQDVEKAKARLAAEGRASRKEKTLRHLAAAAKFEYPLGTNFTYKIWKDETAK